MQKPLKQKAIKFRSNQYLNIKVFILSLKIKFVNTYRDIYC